MNPLQQLHSLGQSIWLDYIRRDLLDSDELARMASEGEVRGVTSNPTIFEGAIASGTLYDAAIRPLAQAGWSAEAIFDHLAIQDIRRATDLFLPIYEGTDGQDGYVSIEVNPKLAFETQATLEEAQRLWARVNRPNVMIKIPATEPGIPAIEDAIAEGINVNVTLVFSLDRYGQVMEAYLRGLERRLQEGAALNHVASVASFFVSRVDTLVDRRLEAMMREEGPSAPRAAALRGRAAVANAKLAYAQFKVVFESPRFQGLKDHGAKVQRPLWASTSTKNPAYSDVLYVESLIGPHTVNTLPPSTLEAFKEHGHAERTIDRDLSASRAQLEALETLGLSMAEVTSQLEHEGVEKFALSYQALLDTVESRSRAFGKEIAAIQSGYGDALKRLETHEFGVRLWARDPTVWVWESGPEASQDDRFRWLDAPRIAARELVELRGLHEAMRREGRDVVGWIGLGSCADLADALESLGARDDAYELVSLDSLDPGAVGRYMRRAPARRSLTIIGDHHLSKWEIDALSRALSRRAARSMGKNAGHSLVALCRRDSALGQLAVEQGFRRVFHEEPDPGGLFAALSVPLLLPLRLAGGSVEPMLEGGRRMARECGPAVGAPGNPGLSLGAMLAGAIECGRDKLTLVADPALEAFAGWLGAALAPRLGGSGRGLTPIAGEPVSAAGAYGVDRLMVYLRHLGDHDDRVQGWIEAGLPVLIMEVHDPGELGATIYRWQVAVAAMCHLLGSPAIRPKPPDWTADSIGRLLKHPRKRGALDAPRGSWKGEGIAAWSSDRSLDLEGDSPLEAFAAAVLQGLAEGSALWLLPYHDVAPRERKTWSKLQAAVRDRRGAAVILEGARSHMLSRPRRSAADPKSSLALQVVLEPARDLSMLEGDLSLGTIVRAKAWAEFAAMRKGGHRILGILLPSRWRIADLVQALIEAAK